MLTYQKWIEALDNNHWLRMELEEAVRNAVDEVARLRDIDNMLKPYHL